MILSLQFLRFLAASLVVLTHVRLEFDKVTPDAVAPIGAFGVDMFFVISGFIMSHISERRPDDFLLKRLIRIVPLYWAFTLALAVIALVLPSLLNSARFDVAHLLASLFFFPLWTEGTEFKPILMLGWTLNYEMFFYLLFCLAMTITHRYREYLCSAMVLAISLSLGALDPAERSPLLFYADTIMIEFVFGMLLGVAYRRYEVVRGGLHVGLAIPLLLGCAFAFSLTDGDSNASENIPRFIAWGLPALGTVFAVMGIERYFQRMNPGTCKAVLLAGEISYPLYLMHIYVIAVLSRVLGVAGMGITVFFALTLTLASIASYLSLRFYDVPLREALSRRFIPARTSADRVASLLHSDDRSATEPR